MYFKYAARTKEGKFRKGLIEASSRKDALNLLERYGLFATSLKPAGKQSFLEKKVSLKRITLKDITIFTRQFSVMLKAGISPIESLKAQIEAVENSDFREKILKIAELIERGKTLSQAFSTFPKIFDPFFVSVIKSGEMSGNVANSLNYLADHLEKKHKLEQRVKGAMVYPCFILLAFTGVFFLTSFFIIPNLIEMLEKFEGKLPTSTKIIIAVSEFTIKGGWLIIVAFLGILIFLIFNIKRFQFSKKIYDRYILKVPIIGDLTKKIYLTRFCENFSVLLSAGLPITQALKITEDIIDNSVYKEIVQGAYEEVLRGENISSVFSKYPKQIPYFVLQMILVGEKTGKLDNILMEVVKFYQEEIDRITMNISSIVEPVMILGLGAGIGALAFAVFIPLFKIGTGGIGGAGM